jgi:hypothetical protein
MRPEHWFLLGAIAELISIVLAVVVVMVFVR